MWPGSADYTSPAPPLPNSTEPLKNPEFGNEAPSPTAEYVAALP